jgi:hypothetical protein
MKFSNEMVCKSFKLYFSFMMFLIYNGEYIFVSSMKVTFLFSFSISYDYTSLNSKWHNSSFVLSFV